MAKTYIHIIFFIGLSLFCLSQNTHPTDSSKAIAGLRQSMLFAKNDSARIIAMQEIGFFYERLNVDSSLKYFNLGLNLARQKSYAWGEARILAGLSGGMINQGKYVEAFELLFESLKIAEENNLGYDIARAYRRIGGVYAELQNYSKAIAYLLKALQTDEANQYPDKVAIDHYALADYYEKLDKLDSAAFHVNFALIRKDLLTGLMKDVYAIDGHIKQKKENYEQAGISYRKGFEEAQLMNDLISSSEICAAFADLYIQLNLNDSALFYALKGFNYGKEISYKKGLMLNGYLLAKLYDSIEPSLALKYFKIASDAKDSLFGVNHIQTIQNLVTREEAKQKELEDAKIAYRNKLRLYGLLTGLLVLLIIAYILYRNNRHKQKANVQLQQQKTKIETTLSELRATQSQLIQSEKMASLGELTAGIAHEIQNPLNFVNNFSEVNKDLLVELKDEIRKGNLEEVVAIADDLISNEEKINHHGKRADAIVKGMLQHSRTSSGQKELTDINALCEEYLRLAYHGLKAKDQSFNASFHFETDETLPKVNVVPQDMGRVLLNLINNAFQAVGENVKSETANVKGDSSSISPFTFHFEPMVTVTTKKFGDRIEISVKDNGSGIPDSIKDKIFQPFFTTKPTGQGTGLGLSLSYDIVKAHGGEIKVETTGGKGCTFSIILPYYEQKR